MLKLCHRHRPLDCRLAPFSILILVPVEMSGKPVPVCTQASKAAGWMLSLVAACMSHAMFDINPSAIWSTDQWSCKLILRDIRRNVDETLVVISGAVVQRLLRGIVQEGYMQHKLPKTKRDHQLFVSCKRQLRSRDSGKHGDKNGRCENS